MARGNRWDDSVFQKLLKGYQRPGLSDAKLNELGLAESVLQFPRPKAGFRHFVPGIAAAAGLFLIAGAVFYFAVWQGNLAEPYVVVSADSEQSVSTPGLIESSNKPLSIRTADQTITLAPHSRVLIESDPLRRLTGNAGNIYRLKTGGMAVQTQGVGNFVVETPWGSVRQVATVFECKVLEDGVDLRCLEGTLVFETPGGQRYSVTKDQMLRVREFGARIEVDSISSGPIQEILPLDTGVSSLPSSTSPTVQAAPLNDGLENKPTEALWSINLQRSPQAIVHHGAWVVLGYNDELATMSEANGRELARRKLGGPLESLEVVAGLVIVYSSGVLQAFRVSDLTPVWKAETGRMSFTTFTVQEGRVYLPSVDGNLYIHDVATGNSIKRIAVGVGLYGKPLVHKGAIYFSTLDRRLVAYRESDNQMMWEYQSKGRFVSDKPRMVGNLVVDDVSDGSFVALDPAKGTLAWTVPYEGKLISEQIAWKSMLVFQDSNGLKSISAAGTLERLSVPQSPLLGMGLAGERLYLVRNDGLFLMNDKRRVEQKLSLALKAGHVGSNMILVETETGKLEAYVP